MHKPKNIYNYLFIISFCFITIFSFINIEQSYSPFQYNGPGELEKLPIHYENYKNNFKKFTYDTLIFNEGDTESSANSFFFLLPVFAGVDILGGLSYGNLCRIVAIYGILSILMLFLFLKNYFSDSIAFFCSLFYSFSLWYQELFRAGTYHGPTILIALIVLWLSFWIIDNKKLYYVLSSFILGLLIGISYYYYGMIRGLILFALFIIFLNKYKVTRKVMFFLLGFFCIITYGVFLRYIQGGAFFDHEHFLVVKNNPWIALLLRPFRIFHQFFTPYVETSFRPSALVPHSRLLHPLLFIPFISGIIIMIKQKNKKASLLNVFSLILYLSVVISNDPEVHRMSLLIIPLYIYTGVGVDYIYTQLMCIKNVMLSFFVKLGFLLLLGFIVINSMVYINKNILNSDRTLGFLTVAQEIKKQNIQGNIILLLNKDQESLRNFIEIDYQTLLEIENHKNVSSGNLNISTVYYNQFLSMLKKRGIKSFYLIHTPFLDYDVVKTQIMKNGFSITEKATIISPPLLEKAANDPSFELDFKLLSKYFKILLVKS